MLCLMRHSVGVWYRLCILINNFRESCPQVPKLAPHYSTPTQRLIKADKICFSQIVGDVGSNALNRRILENFCFVVFSILMLSQTKHTKLGFFKNSDFQICLKAFQNRAPAIQSPGQEGVWLPATKLCSQLHGSAPDPSRKAGEYGFEEVDWKNKPELHKISKSASFGRMGVLEIQPSAQRLTQGVYPLK